ncbi:MAG: ASCH domain-containing protein [Anaerolineae bacterium]|nr:ASCH domain-containing protein [Anaerolineae bacterium]
MTTNTDAFWASYLATLPEDHPHQQATYSAWQFGDNPELANELSQLVLAGIKTGTASLMWEYDTGDEPLPQPGDLSIILDGANQPLCIIETTSIDIRPFNEVTAEHAYSEGEGDRSLQDWRDGHWRYFGRVCEHIGRTATETMPVVCERFRVIFQG